MPTARNYFRTGVLDGKPYAVGGENNDDGCHSSVERYDPAANAWEAVAEAVAPMPTARTYVGTAVLDGKLYVAGGHDAGFNALSSVEAVAPMAETRHSPHTPWQCSTASCTLCGRHRQRRLPLGAWDVERYDPAANTWEAAAPLQKVK